MLLVWCIAVDQNKTCEIYLTVDGPWILKLLVIQSLMRPNVWNCVSYLLVCKRKSLLDIDLGLHRSYRLVQPDACMRLWTWTDPTRTLLWHVPYVRIMALFSSDGISYSSIAFHRCLRGTRSNDFSRSRKARYIGVSYSQCFSMSCLSTNVISVVPFPLRKPCCQGPSLSSRLNDVSKPSLQYWLIYLESMIEQWYSSEVFALQEVSFILVDWAYYWSSPFLWDLIWYTVSPRCLTVSRSFYGCFYLQCSNLVICVCRYWPL